MDIDQQVSTVPVDAPPRRRLGLPRSPATLAIVILLAMVLAEAVLLFRGNSGERVRTEVLQTSQRFLTLLTTYNSETLEEQRAEVLELATGRFRSEYSELTGTEFLTALREREADSKGRVLRAAVNSVDGDSATSLSLVEVSITNRDLETPRVEQNLIELSLVRTSSGWRIDAVSILGTVG